jgi:hypothetical protein
MADYKEITGTIAVPPNTGRAGFLRAIDAVLKKSRVQNVEIDARGRVKFRRFVLNGEEDDKQNNFGVDFEDLQPFYVVRNARVQELILPADLPAPVVLGIMFEKVAHDQLAPLAVVVGAQTTLWDWYRFTTGHTLQERETIFGFPIYNDRHIPDTALLLCAGYGKDAAFVDTQVSYKVEMPTFQQPDPLETPT